MAKNKKRVWAAYEVNGYHIRVFKCVGKDVTDPDVSLWHTDDLLAMLEMTEKEFLKFINDEDAFTKMVKFIESHEVVNAGEADYHCK